MRHDKVNQTPYNSLSWVFLNHEKMYMLKIFYIIYCVTKKTFIKKLFRSFLIKQIDEENQTTHKSSVIRLKKDNWEPLQMYYIMNINN